MQFSRELGYTELMERVNKLSFNHSLLEMTYIGQSVFDRPIPLITLGDRMATKSVLYVSTHHACENICASVLLNFVEEYLNAHARGGQMCGINVKYLYKMRKIYIVPMLNPDGVEYRLRGVSDDNPIRERILAYNGGDDFSGWSANARGVDLNHNYDAYFDEYKVIEKEKGITGGRTKYSGEYAESEPETAALAGFIRYNAEQIEGILTLHTQGEEFYYKSRGKTPPRGEHLARVISRMTGYSPAIAEGESGMGGLTDWFIKEFNKPSFTVECGKGKNPLPMSQSMLIYSRLRELLFTFPILF